MSWDDFVSQHWVQVTFNIVVVFVVALVVRFIARRTIHRVVKASALRRLQSSDDLAAQAFGRPATRAEKHMLKNSARAAAAMAASGTSPEQRAVSRADTLSNGLCLLVDWVLGIVVVLTALNELGVKLTPLLTSAGVSGIIVGLGAQSLIRDLIAGIFLIVEGQYGVGDTIDVGTVRGTVQEIGSRVTRLQASDGEIWYVRNGEISTLGNRSQGWVTSDVEITLPPGRDPDEVIDTLRQVADELDSDPNWHDRLLRAPVVVGLTSFDTTQMVFTIKVSSPQQSSVEQEVRARALAALAVPDEHGV